MAPVGGSSGSPVTTTTTSTTSTAGIHRWSHHHLRYSISILDPGLVSDLTTPHCRHPSPSVILTASSLVDPPDLDDRALQVSASSGFSPVGSTAPAVDTGAGLEQKPPVRQVVSEAAGWLASLIPHGRACGVRGTLEGSPGTWALIMLGRVGMLYQGSGFRGACRLSAGGGGVSGLVSVKSQTRRKP